MSASPDSCVSTTIGSFLREWNDSLDDDRQMLKPYAARVLDTATTAEDEERRGWLATDWVVREFAPAWLDLAGLTEHAQNLRELPELSSRERAISAQPVVDDARYAAAEASAAESAGSAAAWLAYQDARQAAHLFGSCGWLLRTERSPRERGTTRRETTFEHHRV